MKNQPEQSGFRMSGKSSSNKKLLKKKMGGAAFASAAQEEPKSRSSRKSKKSNAPRRKIIQSGPNQQEIVYSRPYVHRHAGGVGSPLTMREGGPEGEALKKMRGMEEKMFHDKEKEALDSARESGVDARKRAFLEFHDSLAEHNLKTAINAKQAVVDHDTAGAKKVQVEQRKSFIEKEHGAPSKANFDKFINEKTLVRGPHGGVEVDHPNRDFYSFYEYESDRHVNEIRSAKNEQLEDDLRGAFQNDIESRNANLKTTADMQSKENLMIKMANHTINRSKTSGSPEHKKAKETGVWHGGGKIDQVEFAKGHKNLAMSNLERTLSEKEALPKFSEGVSGRASRMYDNHEEPTKRQLQRVISEKTLNRNKDQGGVFHGGAPVADDSRDFIKGHQGLAQANFKKVIDKAEHRNKVSADLPLRDRRNSHIESHDAEAERKYKGWVEEQRPKPSGGDWAAGH